MRTIIGVALLVVATSWGCETSKDPASGDGSKFIDDVAALLCDLTAQCCAPHEYAAPSNCLATAQAQLHADVDNDIATRGLQFDPQAADQCLAAFRALAPSCPNSFPGVEICKKVFSASQSKDAGCSGGCAPSDAGLATCLTYSSTAADGAVSAGQICQVVATVDPGAACDTFGRLPFERHCDWSKNSNCVPASTGAGTTCSIPRPIGAACTSTNSSECVPEAICSANVCVARVAIGGTCSASECVPDAYCDTTTSKCRPISRWEKICGGDFN